MRTFARLLCVSVLVFVPACSLLFDGSGYRSGADAGGSDGGRPDTGPGTSCGDPSECDIGEWCDLAVTATCMPGCDENLDCDVDEICDFTTHVCMPLPGCSNDMDCADVTGWCDGGTCSPCDDDNDGFAIEGQLFCVRPATGLRPGDCDDDDETVFPFAPPDCDPTTPDTCGSGAGILAPEVFEMGLVGLGNIAANVRQDSLNVFTLVSSPDGLNLVVLFRDDASGLPFVAQPIVYDGDVASTADANGLPEYEVAPVGVDTLVSSGMAAVVDPDHGGVQVGLLDAWSAGGASVELWQYSAYVRAGGIGPVSATYRRGVSIDGLVPPYSVASINGIAASHDPRARGGSAGFLGVAVGAQDMVGNNFEGLLLLGMDNGHMQTYFGSGSGFFGVSGGISGSVGSAIVTAGRSGILYWNGAVGGDERFSMVDSRSSSRSALTSSWPDFGSGNGSSGLTMAPTGGAQMTIWRHECDDAGATSTCQSFGPYTFDWTNDLGGGASDPLLVADELGGGTSLVVGRTMSPTGDLMAAVLRRGSDPVIAPTGSSAILPIRDLGALNDLDIGVLAVPDLATGTVRANVAFAAAAPGTIRYGAVRICATAPSTP